MKAILTLDNGKKIVADILPPPIGKLRRPRFHDKVCIAYESNEHLLGTNNYPE